MKRSYRIHRAFLTCFLGFLILIGHYGCAMIANPWVSKDYDKRRYKRIGILINRVGNKLAYAPMRDITLKTDYSIRTPTLNTNVYIDDEERLHESVPTYPYYSGSSNNFKIQYYKNMTPDVFRGIKQILVQKGYETVDVRRLSKTWSTAFSEMTIDEILSAIERSVDALLVLHYMDIGTGEIGSKAYGVKAQNKGFTSVLYRFIMFDVHKKEKILSYSPILGFDVNKTLINDHKIMSNPSTRNRIKVICKGDFYEKNLEINHDFTDDELVQYFVNKLLYGFDCPKTPFVKCQDYGKLDCRELEGLNSIIP